MDSIGLLHYTLMLCFGQYQTHPPRPCTCNSVQTRSETHRSYFRWSRRSLYDCTESPKDAGKKLLQRGGCRQQHGGENWRWKVRLCSRLASELASLIFLSFNVALQDGKESGQTVPHVHCHIIPRTTKDSTEGGGIYDRLQGEEGNVGGGLWDQSRPTPIGEFPRIEDADRKRRSAEEMNKEAAFFRKQMELLEDE